MASFLRTFSLPLRAATGLVARARVTPQAMMATPTAMATATSPATTFGAISQQVRGMKVHSSVKKRCEHCKVGRPGG